MAMSHALAVLLLTASALPAVADPLPEADSPADLVEDVLPEGPRINTASTVLDYYGPSCKTQAAPPLPATCGTTVFAVAGSAGGGSASGTVLAVSALGGTGQRIGVGYGGFNLGIVVDLQPMSPVQIAVDIESFDGCSVSGTVAFDTFGLGTVKGLRFSVGSDLTPSDPGSATYGVGVLEQPADSATWDVDIAVCLPNADVEIHGPALESLVGRVDAYSFDLAGVPGFMEIDYGQSGTFDVVRTLTFRHDSLDFRGNVDLGDYGRFDFTALPQLIQATVATRGGDLSLVRASASSAPDGGANTMFSYDGQVGGASVYVQMDKVRAIDVRADLQAQDYDVVVTYANGGPGGTLNVFAQKHSEFVGFWGDDLHQVSGHWNSASGSASGQFNHDGVMGLSLELPVGTFYAGLPRDLDFTVVKAADGNLASVDITFDEGSAQSSIEYRGVLAASFTHIKASDLHEGRVFFEPAATDFLNIDASFGDTVENLQFLYLRGATKVELASGSVADVDFWMSKASPRIDLTTRLVQPGFIRVDAHAEALWGNYYPDLDTRIERYSPDEYCMQYPFDFDSCHDLEDCATGTFGLIRLCGIGP